MYVVKEYYGKTGDNPVMHFVVSYDNKTVRTAEAACALTQKIAMFFAPDYQLITVVHKENQGHSDYHAHIILNTVNLKTGKLYHSGSKKKNVRFGRPPKSLPNNWQQIIADVRSGNKRPVEAIRELGISRSYYYKLYSDN